MTDIKTGPDFAFPMEDAPKDGSILRLLVKFDRKSAAGPFEDTTEPSWTIGTNNKANTGEDQWDIVGWSWEQDVFCHAYGAKAIGWLPFHTESNEPTGVPSPAPAESGAVANAYADLMQRQTDTDPDIAAIVGQNRSKLYMAPAPSASMGRVTEEVIDALISACNQIEYLHGKFEETGSGNAMIASLTDLRRRLQRAALDSPPVHGGGEGWVLPEDLFTHRAAWRNGLVEAKHNASPPREDEDDGAYWQHEIDVFDRVFDALASLPTQVSGSMSDPDTGEDGTKRTHRVMVEDIDGLASEWCATEDLMHAEEECLNLRREGRVAWVESK